MSGCGGHNCNCNRATQAYRFLTLVDVLYEHRVRLVCSATVEPLDLFAHIHTQADYRELVQRGEVCFALGLTQD